LDHAARSLATSSQEKDLRLDEAELTRTLKTAFEGFQNEVAENVFVSLANDTREALPEMIRVELEAQRRSYLIEILDKAGWYGPQYQLARNSYLLDLYRDELPDNAKDVQQFIREHPIVADLPLETVERICTTLQAEFSVL
jgi:hypothetical protein